MFPCMSTSLEEQGCSRQEIRSGLVMFEVIISRPSMGSLARRVCTIHCSNDRWWTYYFIFTVFVSTVFSEYTPLHLLDAWFHLHKAFEDSFTFQLCHATGAHIVLSHASPMSKTDGQSLGFPSQRCRQNTTHTKQRHRLNYIRSSKHQH